MHPGVLGKDCGGDACPLVVCLPEGIWVDVGSDGRDTAGTANMFTATEGTTPGTACIMHGVAVEVRRALTDPEASDPVNKGANRK